MQAIRSLSAIEAICIKKQRGTSTNYTLQTSTEIGTSTNIGTGTEIGTRPVPKTGLAPVPKTVPKPKRTSKEPKSKKRASQVPDNFCVTDSMKEWASENEISLDLKRATADFVDYWKGEGKAKVDWVATWRNSIRKQQGWADEKRGQAGRGNTNPPGRKQSLGERVKSKARERHRDQGDVGVVAIYD